MFWDIFWMVFWVIVLILITGLGIYLILILRNVNKTLKTASLLSEQVNIVFHAVKKGFSKENFNAVSILARLIAKFKRTSK